jgi:hypothetical protein
MDLAHEDTKLSLEFSHGMKKKLALAAALIPNPDLLFLDEPFEGVDAVASRTLRDTLKHVVNRGATVFLTSHVLEIVESSAPTSASSPRAAWCIRARWTSCDRADRSKTSFWRSSARAMPTARSSAGSRPDVNRDQLKTILWLRWRLTRNQWRKGGNVGAAIAGVVFVAGLVLAACTFTGAILSGCSRSGTQSRSS